MGGAVDSRRVSVWDRFAENVSLGSYAPVLHGDLTWARMTTRHDKPNIMLADRPRKYLRVTERDDFLAQRMDGTRRVSDLVVDYFEKFGTFGLKQVTNLVTTLRQNGFLTDPPRDVWKDLAERLNPAIKPPARRWTEGTAMNLKVPLHGTDGFFTAYHKVVGPWIFSRLFLVFSSLVSVAGLAAFVTELARGRDPFAPIAGSGVVAIVTFMVAYYITIIIHESAHALTTKHYGRLHASSNTGPTQAVTETRTGSRSSSSTSSSHSPIRPADRSANAVRRQRGCSLCGSLISRDRERASAESSTAPGRSPLASRTPPGNSRKRCGLVAAKLLEHWPLPTLS